jgi:hypothetical protein
MIGLMPPRADEEEAMSVTDATDVLTCDVPIFQIFLHLDLDLVTKFNITSHPSRETSFPI